MTIGAGLTLVTGPTGGGKSALVVSWLRQVTDRPIFVMGIPDLQIEHQPTPPVAEWTELRRSDEDPDLYLPYFTFPAGAIVVIDEAQRVFRPRSAASKVPPEVAAFETRRHTGADFVLITQAPHLLDSNVRRLVTRHVHIHDTFMGRYKLEWVGIGDPEQKSSREIAVREKYSPPREVFGLYKSAELHTQIKRKTPISLYAVALCVPLLIGLSYYAYNRIAARTNVAPSPAANKSNPTPSAASHGAPASTGQALQPILPPDQYINQHQPRIEGLAHSAPVYDAVTQPVEAPIPAACLETKSNGCRCYTQRGTPYLTTEVICKQVVAGGYFVPWRSTNSAAGYSVPAPLEASAGAQKNGAPPSS